MTEGIMRRLSRLPAVLAALASLAFLLYGAKAAAFLDPGGDAMLADLLANAAEQLKAANDSLAQLRQSYMAVKRLAEYADDAASAARSFQKLSAGGAAQRLRSDIDGAYPDLELLRRDALKVSGASGGPWALGTGSVGNLSSYCLSGGAGARAACAELHGQVDSARVLAALGATFGPSGSGSAQAKVVDAEAAAAIASDRAQGRATALEKARLQQLLDVCNGSSGTSLRDAKSVAEECRLAAEQAQVLQLGQGQETNLQLGEITRLHAIAIAQKNADLKRDVAEQDARRAALTSGVDELAQQRVGIRTGGVEP